VLDERGVARAHIGAVKLFNAEQVCGIARGQHCQGVIFELRPMTFDGGKLCGGKPAKLDDERRRRCKRAERIGVCDAENLLWRLAAYASLDEGRCDMSHNLSHATARHSGVVQRRALLAQRGHGRRGSLVNRDVIGMAVKAVFAEGDYHVWTKAADGAADVRFEPLRLSPGQHPVLVVEQHQIGYAEDTRGVP